MRVQGHLCPWTHISEKTHSASRPSPFLVVCSCLIFRFSSPLGRAGAWSTEAISYVFMSTITISAILTIIRIALTLGEKLVRSIYMILDIVDDGVINSSVPKPAWYEKVVSAINNIEFALHSVSDVADSLSQPAKVEQPAE